MLECVCQCKCVGRSSDPGALRMSASDLLRHHPSNWLFPEGSAVQQGEQCPRPEKPGPWSVSREGRCILGLLSSRQSLRRQLRTPTKTTKDHQDPHPQPREVNVAGLSWGSLRQEDVGLREGLWAWPPACALALLEGSLHFRTPPPLLLRECNRVALRTNRSMLSSFRGKCSAKSETHILLSHHHGMLLASWKQQ